jgi:hypothetical protein
MSARDSAKDVANTPSSRANARLSGSPRTLLITNAYLLSPLSFM